MRSLLTVLSVSLLLSSLGAAESAGTGVKMQNQMMHEVKAEVHEEMQNRFHDMKTDELLEKRGTLTTQQERDQLHNELMSRQHTMTKEQYEKFMKKPENRTPKMKNQGSGQGMMQSGGMGGGMMGGGMGKGGGR